MHGYLGHAGQDGDIRTQPARRATYIAGPVGSDFEHEPRRVGLRHDDEYKPADDVACPLDGVFPCVLAAENGKRHAYLTVETFLALANVERARETSVYRVFGRRLPDAPCHRDDARLVARQDRPCFPREYPYHDAFDGFHCAV